MLIRYGRVDRHLIICNYSSASYCLRQISRHYSVIFFPTIYQFYHFVRKISLNSIWWFEQHHAATKELKKLKGLTYRLSRLERNAPLSDLSKFNSPQTGIKELLKKCRTTQWHFYESPTPTPTRFYCILMLAKLYMSHTLVFLAFHMSDIEYCCRLRHI